MILELKGVDAVHTLLFKSSDLNQDELNELLKVFLETAGENSGEVNEDGR